MPKPAPRSGWSFWANRMLGRGPDRAMPTSWSGRSTTARCPACRSTARSSSTTTRWKAAASHHRWIWHRCPCCPPNIARTVASIGSYMYGVSDDEIAVHLYGESTARLLVGSTPVDAAQDDGLSVGWPRDDHRSTATPRQLRPCACAFPAGASGAALSINGANGHSCRSGPRLFRLRRTLAGGDNVDPRHADECPRAARQSRRQGGSSAASP